MVIMTLGKDGAIASNGIETIKFDTMATEVKDATGAGDAFAGGFLGYLSKIEPQQNGRYDLDEIKRGVVHGNIIGSFVCEDFSIGRLRTLTIDDVARRYQHLVEYSHFDPNWRHS